MNNNQEIQIIRNDDIIIGYVGLEDQHSHIYEHEQAYQLLNSMLQEYFDTALEYLNLEKMDNGKPYFVNSDIHFNLSHCRGMAVCAISRKYELGIDVEGVRAYPEKVAHRVFSATELSRLQGLQTEEEQREYFYEVWTYKESAVKLSGDGIKNLMAADSAVELEDKAVTVCRKQVVYGGKKYQICMQARAVE